MFIYDAIVYILYFFFSSRRRHTRCSRDWSSDVCSSDLLAQPPQHRHKSKKPAAPPCREGCKPETAAPQVAVGTPEDDAAEKELSALSRELRNGAPDAYGKLSAFATRNTTNVWGARAALALGYQDFSKNRMAQALGWLLKSQGDALLREYALYWTAQTQRNLGRNAEAYKTRSEERRVGKECRSRWSPYH